MSGFGIGGPLDSGDLILRSGGRPAARTRFDQSAVRSTLVALASTVVFFTVVGWIVIN